MTTGTTRSTESKQINSTVSLSVTFQEFVTFGFKIR